ncbi:MAG: dihydrofolate reductase family protein, partial [Thermoleophilaceae bacterium]|nr:dihydrofolate reductase family protein [Thermoleophilaceae bacterium]
ATLTADEAMAGLGLGDLAPPERPYVVLNMVATLDGKAALGGRTAGIGSPADRELFHHLRTQADAVMAGAGTLRAERYGRIVREPALREKREREGLGPDPLACVVSASLDGLAELPLLAVPEQRVAVLTAASGELPSRDARVEYARGGPAEGGGGWVDLRAALGRLRAEWGVRSVLCEGGPTLNAELLRAGLVDELFLSVAPKLAGGADALTIVAGAALPEPAELELVWLLERRGELFLRWRVRGWDGGGTAEPRR